MRDGQIDRRWLLGGALLAAASAACGQNGSPVGRSVRSFGARGDGTTDDAPAIQRAIDAVAGEGGGTVLLDPGTYLLRYRTSDDGDGASALTLRSGVTLAGADAARCILRLAPGQYGPGTYARIIASKGELARAALRGLTIDGNRAAQGRFRDDVSGAAVLLGWKGRCVDVAVERIVVHDVVGQGIMLQGSVGNVSRNLRIADNHVSRTSYIGIQGSQFDGLDIARNRVEDCGDNGIDIYGDDTVSHSTVATSHHATITGNHVQRCRVGLFLETVADCTATRNVIEQCLDAGVRINRIHGEPRNLTVANNRIAGSPSGVIVGGDTGGVAIRDNEIAAFTRAGVEFGYNVSRVSVTGNRFRPESASVPIVLGQPTGSAASAQEKLVRIEIDGNRVPAGHADDRLFVNRYRQSIDMAVGRFVRD